MEAIAKVGAGTPLPLKIAGASALTGHVIG